jgi:cytochrome P450
VSAVYETDPTLYRPPAPLLLSPVRALLRTMTRPDRDLLGLLPAQAYQDLITPLGSSRRGILLVNEPAAVSAILADPDGVFPKSDLMVGALMPLVGESIFVSHGALWKRQRAMIEPAFSHMRVNRAFAAMSAAVDDFELVLDEHAARGTTLGLDTAMSQLTADIITRTIFTRGLESAAAREVFTNFAEWQGRVAQVDLKTLLLGRPFADVPQPAGVVEACRRIREHIGTLLDERLAPDAPVLDDIAGAAIAARDPHTGAAFSREELIDEISTFFLAGHETTASALTWTFFLLSQQPAVAERLRNEVVAVAGTAPVEYEQLRRFTVTRNVFRETLRLYPPLTFIPRVAADETTIAGRRVKRGTMVMLSPWTMHRHTKLWPSPDRFDPDRFAAERERTHVTGAYLPYGAGPRVCVGAAFAQTESALILARFVRRYTFSAINPDRVEPSSRLTTRPLHEIQCQVQLR